MQYTISKTYLYRH